MKTSLILLAVLAVYATAPAGQPGPFKVTTKRSDDAVKVTAEQAFTRFDITSPFGISHAVIERTDARWPQTVALRLRLKGLEGFRAANGKVTLHAAGSGKKQRLWKDGKENAPLDRNSPFWMEIRAVDRNGKVVDTPVKDGYFEMMLPRAFFADNPRSITVNWIDFYR